MIEIEYKKKLDDNIYEMIDVEFNKYAIKNGVECNYNDFNFIAKDEKTKEFFKTVQNKMHYAVHGNTAAEVIFEYP